MNASEPMPPAAPPSQPFRIAYLPYLFEKRQLPHIDCGGVVAWNFKYEAESRVGKGGSARPRQSRPQVGGA
jgi:hypothetical protein